MTTLAAAPLCVGPQALVCGGVLLALTAGTLIAGAVLTSDNIGQADQTADEDLATSTTATDACAECSPECRLLIAEVDRLAAEVETRYNLMLIDQHGLYANYRTVRNRHPVHGSWAGHITFYNRKQAELRTAIAFADASRCPVTARARELSTRPPPIRPNR